MPTRLFWSDLAFSPDAITVPAPSLPTARDWPSRARTVAMRSLGTSKPTAGRSAVPLALSVDTLAGPSNSPISLGLIGAASTFTITSSAEGGSSATSSSVSRSVPSSVTVDRSSRPVTVIVPSAPVVSLASRLLHQSRLEEQRTRRLASSERSPGAAFVTEAGPKVPVCFRVVGWPKRTLLVSSRIDLCVVTQRGPLTPLARSREEQSSRDGKHVIARWQRKARVIRHAVSCECRIPAEMRWAQPMLHWLLSFMLPAKTDGGRSATAGSQGRESRVVWNASGCIEGDSII